MKLSGKSISILAKIVTGDSGLSPYRTGPQLVDLFNGFGGEVRYEAGFPSRWMFAEGEIHRLNGTNVLPTLIRHVLDPRDFLPPKSVKPAFEQLKIVLRYDGYDLVMDGDFVLVKDLNGARVEMTNPLADTSADAEQFIDEQVKKAETKIQSGDYDGAITNARALLEAVLSKIEKQFDPNPPKYEGDLIKLYHRVQRHLNLDPARADIETPLKQVLTGLASITSGLAGLRNKMSDAHVRTYKPAKRHALLVVNSAKTLSSFLFDTVLDRKNKST